MMQTLARRIGAGRAVYYTLHRPRAVLQAARRRGYLNTLVDGWHHRQMKQAAARLPCLDVPGRESVRVHFLTGRNFWHQTAFCAWSLSKYGEVNVIPVLHDDGTLSSRYVELLRRIFPQVEWNIAREAEVRLDRCLPRDRFPTLRARRDVYPNLRKLLDVHAGSNGWKLVLDSDMLFFRRPQALLDWLRGPDRPCHMVDCETSYGYPLDFLSRQCGSHVPERVNVGVTGLKSDAIPWEDLERWAREQVDLHGPHYFQEQALIAQLVARGDRCVLDADEYLVQPQGRESHHPRAVLHHYVSGSKGAYYRSGWRQALSEKGQPMSPESTPTSTAGFQTFR